MKTKILTLFIFCLLFSGIFAKIKFVFVKGGNFEMGSRMSSEDEKPIHTVVISDFYISKTEITQQEWESVMGYNNSHFKGDSLPVESVSWYEALEFCNKKSKAQRLKPVYYINSKMTTMDINANGYRLPTESEWEFAARGGNKAINTIYSGGNLPDIVGHLDAKRTYPVGQKSPNELGIYDMSGNVAEWCWDWYDIKAYKLVAKSGKNRNPLGAYFGTYRSVRGGSWESELKAGNVAFRHYQRPIKKTSTIGFRVVRKK